MWIYDAKSLKIIEVNNALINLTGYEPSDFANLTVQDLFHTIEIPLLLADLKKISVTNLSLGRKHLRRKNGALISVELITQAFDKTTRSILIVAKQVAVVDRATTPREKNQLRHAVLENLRGVIIFSLDAQYRYIAFTASHKEVMKSIWGVDIEIGMNMLDCISREAERTRAKHNFDRALQGEHITLEEEYNTDSENYQKIWWENRYAPVYDLDNNIIGLTIFVIDITYRKQMEQALQASENNYRSIMGQASDGIFIADANGKYLDVNEAGCSLLGYSYDEILQLSIRDVTVLIEAPPLRLNELLEGKTILSEREMIRKDGSRILVEISAKMLADGRLQGIVRDITERKQVENALRISEARLRTITDNAPDLIAEVNSDGRILFINHVLPGYKLEDVIGQDFCNWVAKEDVPLLREKLALTYQTAETQEYEVLSAGAYGELRWYMTRISPVVVNEKVSRAVLISRDITERKKIEDEILNTKEAVEKMNALLQKAFEHEQIASRTDNLTGTFNRRYFFEFIEYEFSISKRYDQLMSVVLLDVDNFKQINDTYGHLAGDEVLVFVAKTVQSELRDSDVLARYGGDEFIILVPNNGSEDVRNLIERIREKLESSIVNTYGNQLKVTISAGIADLQPNIDTATKLVYRADQALYIAKQSGRNRIAYSPI